MVDQDIPAIDSSPTPTPPTTKSTWRWVDVLLILIAVICIFFLGIGLVEYFSARSGNRPINENEITLGLTVALTALEGIALIGGVYLMGMRRRGYNWQEVGVRPTSHAWHVRAFWIGVIIIPVSGMIAVAIQELLGLPLSNPQLPFLAPEGFSWFGFLSLLLLGGILVPFAEELFFRGVLYEWLRFRWGFWLAMIVSSAIFGILHGEISIAITAAILGGILAWVYERSKSLWPAFIIHAMNNSAKIILIYALLALGIQLTS